MCALALPLSSFAALSFDGVNAYVEIADSPSLGVDTTASVAMWVNPGSLGVVQRLYTKIDSSVSGIGVDINASNQFRAFFKGGVPANSLVTSVTTAQVGGWFHVAATFNGSGNFIIYINGIAEQTLAQTSSSIGTNTIVARIGVRNDITNGFFNGSIEEVRVYNRELTANEIRSLYRFGNIRRGLVGYWPLLSARTEAWDYSRFGNTGKLIGGPGTARHYKPTRRFPF